MLVPKFILLLRRQTWFHVPFRSPKVIILRVLQFVRSGFTTLVNSMAKFLIAFSVPQPVVMLIDKMIIMPLFSWYSILNFSMSIYVIHCLL